MFFGEQRIPGAQRMESHSFERFDIASGAPFNTLQARLGMIRDGQRYVMRRALLFVFIAWGVPLILCAIGGPAGALDAVGGYLGELPVLARFFLAIGLFVIMATQASVQLQRLLQQFSLAPILPWSSSSQASEAIQRAIRRRDSGWAELACLVGAVVVSWLLYTRLIESGEYSWAKQAGEAGAYVTAAGWWVIAISNPLFSFLLFRWVWRFIVWQGLLKSLAQLEMRLVSTHPDGQGGLGFIGSYPNAFMLFVLALGCVIGAVLATLFMQESLEASLYGYVMALWLGLVLVALCVPLLPFNKHLARLKQETLVRYNAIATQHFRAAERSLLGRNVAAGEAEEDREESEYTADPSKTMALVKKQSVTLINLKALLPVQFAALLPVAAAGVTLLPLKEILALMKKVLLF